VPPERLVPAPDCGMKYLPRERAVAKLAALVAGARIVRAEVGGGVGGPRGAGWTFSATSAMVR